MAGSELIAWASSQQRTMLRHRGADEGMQAVPAHAVAILDQLPGRFQGDEALALAAVRCTSWWFLAELGGIITESDMELHFADAWVPLDADGLRHDLVELSQPESSDARLQRLRQPKTVARAASLCGRFRADRPPAPLALLEGLMMFRPGRTIDHDTTMHWFVWSLTELPMRMADTRLAITEMVESG